MTNEEREALERQLDDFVVQKLITAEWVDKSMVSHDTLMMKWTPQGLEKLEAFRSIFGPLVAYGMEPALFFRLYVLLQMSAVARPDSENRIFLGGSNRSAMRSEEELGGYE